MIKGYTTKVLESYEKTREQEQKAFAERRKEINAVIPRISIIDQQITKLFIELSMSALKQIDNREQYIANLKEKITDQRVEKSELLVSKGYPLDYLEQHYVCPICKDTGYIGIKKCDCFNEKLAKLYYANSDLKDILMENNFDRFRLDYFDNHRFKDMESPRKNVEKIVEKSQYFIETFNHQYENLLFYGNAGTGKTFLTHCIAKSLLDKGNLVIYKTSEDLLKALKQVKFEKDYEQEDILINCDLLIIDDLGTEPDSDFSRTEFYNLLNKKLMKKKKMIISTNFTIEQLMKRYSERITSRLFGNFTVHKFYGDDIRIKLNLKKIR